MASKQIGLAIFIPAALFPLMYYLYAHSLSQSFADFSKTMVSLGKIAALVGIVSFSSTLLLNTRLRFLEDLFGGLDKAFKVHHYFGTTSFLLLLFHPLLLASSYLSFSASSALQFLLPGTDLAMNLGILAIFSMQLFLVFTFFIKLPYQDWKLSHRFLGLSFLLASIHVYLMISEGLFLKIYIFAFIAIGMTAYAYRVLLWKTLVKRHEFVVTSVKRLNDNITELTLLPKDELFDFRPGQFVFISVQNSGIRGITGEPHPFTISSSPEEKSLRLSIKASGDFTSELKDLKKGTKALLEGPYGRFLLDEKPDQIFIAGGIGITPLMSFARSIEIGKNFSQEQKMSVKKMQLFWSVINKRDAVFEKELETISKKDKRFRFTLYESGKKGHLTADCVLKESKYKNQDIFLCAPPAMMLALKKQLILQGVKRDKIHMEEFSLI